MLFVVVVSVGQYIRTTGHNIDISPPDRQEIIRSGNSKCLYFIFFVNQVDYLTADKSVTSPPELWNTRLAWIFSSLLDAPKSKSSVGGKITTCRHGHGERKTPNK